MYAEGYHKIGKIHENRGIARGVRFEHIKPTEKYPMSRYCVFLPLDGQQ
jgi:hypothetical protein